MHSFFKNILVPVDFSINTEVAVKKAIEIAEAGTSIYLLHISDAVIPIIPGEQKTDHVNVIEYKINQWRNSIIESGNSNNVFSLVINHKSVQKAIENEVKRLSIDLIIIGKNSNHKWFPFLNTVIPSKLASQTGAVVLTLKPGGIYNRIKTVIVPITGENGMKKVRVIHAICKRSPVKIYLLAFLNDEEKRQGYYATSILNLYQTLKASVNCQIEYTIIGKSNKASAILEYANKFNADILVVTPETDTRIGWPNRYISDVIPSRSKIQVWAV